MTEEKGIHNGEKTVFSAKGFGKAEQLNVSQWNLNTPGGSEVKASASNVGDPGSIPRLGRSPLEGNVNPLQYSCCHNFSSKD